MLSRLILSIALSILGVIIYYMHLDLLRINDSIAKTGEQVANFKFEQLQRAPLIIDKPRVPAIKYLPKKPVTVIDRVCKC